MAWQARLEGVTSNGDKIAASFSFYDDAGPIDPKTNQPVVVWAETFTFDPSYSNQQMQALVKERGANVRAAKLRADALAVAFPAQTTVIPIP